MIVNIVLAFVGAGYLVFAGLQWLAIKEQAKIAEKALTATIRPRIGIRTNANPTPISLRNGGQRLFVQYKISNTGPSPATVISRNFTFLFHKELTLPDAPPYDPAETMTAWAIINGQGGMAGEQQSRIITPQELSDLANGNMVIFWLWFILYTDETGAFHRTASCWIYHPQTHRFAIAANVPTSYFEAS